jgi:sodium-coupled neutral amino acid transporter 11
MQKKHIEAEHKVGIMGTSSNLVVSIVGAGIVGIPYAMQQSGLVAGFVMVILVAFLTEKSLRLLIETAKHIDVPSYETLFEACFGLVGFYSMCATMFIMSYGAMVSYLMIMKDTLAGLVGVAADDYPMKRAVLVISTLVVALPLSCQRDMADLAKTSRISVSFYLCIVSFILVFSPVQEKVAENGGLYEVLSHSIYRPDTFFVGLGVLSFAYVCQHSAFILAGSLERPTNKRWSQVTLISLAFSGLLATACGVSGYLGFLEETKGNVLINFKLSMQDDPLVMRLNTVSYVMLLTCMFFVYPMDAFVLRHVSMVLMFKGRAAHEGNDHLVLARTDRRVLLTFGIYIVTLVPALLLEDLGKVLAVTGAVAGSALGYICPGAAYLAAHGSEFVKLVQRKWTWGNPDPNAKMVRDLEKSLSNDGGESPIVATYAPVVESVDNSSNCVCEAIKLVLGRSAWILSLMPLWMGFARVGIKCLSEHVQSEALKSPAPSKRLGKVAYKRPLSQRAQGVHTPDLARQRVAAKRNVRDAQLEVMGGAGETSSLLGSANRVRHNSVDGMDPNALEKQYASSLGKEYGAAKGGEGPAPISGMGNRAIGAAIMKQQAAGRSGAGVATAAAATAEEEEPDTQADFPQVYDFVVAIFFILFGFVAMVAGLYSILAAPVEDDDTKSAEASFFNTTIPDANQLQT